MFAQTMFVQTQKQRMCQIPIYAILQMLIPKAEIMTTTKRLKWTNLHGWLVD